MLKFRVLSSLLALSGLSLFGADQKFVVTSAAVWNPTSEVLDGAHDACAGKGGSELNSCFADQMKKAGASPEALRFFQAMNNEAFLSRLVRAGGPDIAYVFYPYRANTLDSCLLVNTNGGWIDLEDAPKSAMKELQKNPTFREITGTHRNANLWPGDRGDDSSVRIDNSSHSANQISAEYSLRTCHACANLATIWLRFDFDPKGAFLGAHLKTIHKEATEMLNGIEVNKLLGGDIQ